MYVHLTSAHNIHTKTVLCCFMAIHRHCLCDTSVTDTVEPLLKDHPIGHKYMVPQDRWSLVTGWVALKCRLSARSIWSFKTGHVSLGSGLSWQWSLKTGFTVPLHIYKMHEINILETALPSCFHFCGCRPHMPTECCLTWHSLFELHSGAITSSLYIASIPDMNTV